MNYMEQVESGFNQFVEKYELNSKKSKMTGVQDVLQFMVDHYKTRIWWWSYEFVGKTNSKGGFLSHRAPARASDLALHTPDLVEDRRIGRLKVYRLRLENHEKIKDFLRGGDSA